MTRYALVAGIAFLIALVFAAVIWRLSHRYRLYPAIRERDVHTRPTPRLGGVAMFLGIVVAFLVASQDEFFDLVFVDPGPALGLLGGALVVVLVGVADDIWDLDWLTKLAGQMIAAGILVWQGIAIVSLPINGITILPPYLSLALSVLAIVLVMNAINFIDGLDGLVAGVAIIANSVFFLYTYILSRVIGDTEYFNLASLTSVILLGACAGFLPLNWHRAKLFMGDAGSMLVGLLMAASAMSVTGQIDPIFLGDDASLLLPAFIPIVLPFAVLVVPLLDFGLAIVRRLLAGKSPFSADRKHLHHRLLDMGHSHLHAVLIFYAWTTVVSVGCLLFLVTVWWWAVAFIAIGLLICTVVTLAPLSRRKAVEYLAQSRRDHEPVGPSPEFDGLDAAAPLEDHDEQRIVAEHERAVTGSIPIIRPEGTR
ncbi:MraY family glycosyltransferase [Herbiconiux sp. SYSU D00978]|uniref:MraY family glycosyltransferase n=1 Tax=Herbiconiux sp. SYSU D00978 TaxID=2812562 RepID=UPI001A969904|nr:MraY family glycosyltransferase [Herbiconiux sp. SYSU D00978]